MSMLQQLGARIQATAEELPLGEVSAAAERLRLAADLLTWVRRESADPLGVPELGNATEHLEQAGHALLSGQDSLAEYLAAIGLRGAAPGAPPGPPRDRPVTTAPPTGDDQPADADPAPLRRWWTERVDHLAEHSPDGAAGRGDRDAAAHDSAELLRRAADHVRAGDRAGLRRQLAHVDASVGLGLSALTPALLRDLATDLLGHRPGPEDLSKLESATRGPVRDLLPGVPEQTVATLLSRVCRVPPRDPGEHHPFDSAVTGAVLTGLLLQRLGREPDTVLPEQRRDADEPTGAGSPTNGGRPGAGPYHG